MILLSAHRDTIMKDYAFKYENGVYTGLLDNAIGVLLAQLVVFDDPIVAKLEKQGEVKLWFGDGEEWGILECPIKVTNKDLVIVVDVCCGEQYDGFDCSIENISGIHKKDLTDLRESLEWEGHKVRFKNYDGTPDDEDEAFKWVEKKIPVFSFIIPIEAGSEETGWHNEDCTITYEKMLKCRQILKRTINYML